MPSQSHPAIAIVGMAGRFPDAPDVATFWRNLEQGHESLTPFTQEELLEAGVPLEVQARSDYVGKGSILEDGHLFDAGFFGINAREAELIDPQHRVLLECAWAAMEDAGYGGGSQRNVGVYVGSNINAYLIHLLSNPDVVESAGLYQIMVASDKDFLANRIGYKLDLRGPCVTVQTACSTSLVAVHAASQALLAHECDMALAGGVSLHHPQKGGYLYQEGMIFSPDGRCRPFDAEGRGIRASEGAAIVVLKRLEDAHRDRDAIRGVILGTAVNNDGAEKIGYTAPSVEGQAKVLSAALAAAGVEAGSVSYIEAHGTATPLGDPIEFAGLLKVYGRSQEPCTIGAVKSNLGHLDTAAGVAGLIKTVLAMQHRRIPPTLHFTRPNPQLAWEGSRFHINTTVEPWQKGAGPRRAAVSSFGIGGTNAHAVLEEAPAQAPAQALWPQQLVVLSALTATALSSSAQRLRSHLDSSSQISLPELAYTLQTGRRQFPHRRALVCSTVEELREALQEPFPKEFAGAVQSATDRAVAFMFTGQGSQYHGMGRELYAFQPTFRRAFDRCADLLQSELSLDLRDLLYGSGEKAELHDTGIAQPALFVLEYSLAQMWMRFGLRPVGMIGHSLGEYVAACLAGVFSLDDALRIVAFRGRLMQSMPRGSMLSVGLGEEELMRMMDGSLALAAVNGRSICSVSGPDEEISALQRRLEEKEIPCSRLRTSHAFHSAMMEEAVEPFREYLSQLPRHRPSLPFISNLTGGWITAEEATSPDYWARHLREKVQFEKGIRELVAGQEPVLLEAGPGTALATLARPYQPSGDLLATLPHAKDPQSAARTVLTTVGALWLRGVAIDWEGVHEGESLYRTALPTYPFERKRYFIPFKASASQPAPGPQAAERLEPEKWFYTPVWKRVAARDEQAEGKNGAPWLIFADDEGLAEGAAQRLAERNEPFTLVRAGEAFQRAGETSYTIHPGSMEQYREVLGDLIRKGQAPRTVLFCWGIQDGKASFHHLIRLAQAMGETGYAEAADVLVVSAGMYKVHGDEEIDPDQALLLGPCRTIPLEFPHLQCRPVDLSRGDGFGDSVELLLAETSLPVALHGVAYRKGYRWEQTFESVQLPAGADRIRAGGVYLITGGMGGIGLTLARYLASFGTRLALIGRSPLPPRPEWSSWLETHPGEDRVSLRIQEIRNLEGLGAEVLPLNADVASRIEMQSAIDTVHRQFGRIEGIVHAAGIAGGGLIQIKSEADSEAVMAPKVSGTEIVCSLTADDPVEFLVLCSSVNSIEGMVGGVDYTAANAWLDARAAAASSPRAATIISVNWDTWREVGMAVNTQVPRAMQAARQATLATAIRPEEGIEAFRRILAARLPQVAVVTRDILNRSRQGAAAAAPIEAARQESPAAGHERPELSTPFREPVTDVERTIARIWQEALGQSSIGLDDNFFEVGGHSLVATSILSRVRNAFHIHLPLRVIFETPTVGSLAEHVETLLWNASQSTSAEAGDEREEVEI